jgi:hypothetical protein
MPLGILDTVIKVTKTEERKKKKKMPLKEIIRFCLICPRAEHALCSNQYKWL